MSKTPVRVAVAQAAPALLDLQAAVDAAVSWIGRAAAEGAELVAFGESFLPGYPFWCDAGEYSTWDHPPARALHARLVSQSLVVPSPEVDAICAAARAGAIAVVIGANERTPSGSLYNALLFVDRDGVLRDVHRKLVPTHGERLVHMPGDAAALTARDLLGRADAPVGGLICWEHWMPLPRQVLHAAGERLHVSAWPACRDEYHLASRHYAFEGRCVVLSAALVQRVGDLPDDFEMPGPWAGKDPDALIMNGGASIIGPDARELVGPVRDVEKLLVAEVDPVDALGRSQLLDVAGHYARPDVFRLHVRRDRLRLVVDEEDAR